MNEPQTTQQGGRLPLDDPDSLDRSSSQEILADARPIVARRLSENNYTSEVADEAILETVQKLAERWQREPRGLGLRQFVVQRLAREVADQLYPRDRRDPAVALSSAVAAPSDTEHACRPLAEVLDGYGVHPASQIGVRALVDGVREGTARNGYTAARALGRTRAEAQRGAATAAHLAACDYVESCVSPAPVEGFSFVGPLDKPT